VTFTIASATNITISITPSNNRDVMLHLYNGNTGAGCAVTSAQELACMDNFLAGFSETLNYSGLPAGTYYVRVQAYNNNTLNSNSFVCVYGTPAGICVTPPNAGSGGTANICSASGSINLFTYLGGSPTPGGTWTDNMNSGALTGSFLNTNLLSPGVYTFTYTVTAPSCPSSSAVVTVNAGGGGIPTVVCPSDITTTNGTGLCGASVNYSLSIVDDCTSGTCAPSSIPGFVLIGTLNGHTYFRSTTAALWPNANATANSLGGHLATISTAVE